MDPILIQQQLEQFQQWIIDEGNLPKKFDKINLVRYLKASEFNLEKSKELFISSLEWRRKYPNVFTQRDPHSPEIVQITNTVQYSILPSITANNYRISVIRLIDPDPEKIVFNNVIKVFFMIADARLASADEIWSDGEVPIWDMTNISFRHLTKIVFSTLRLFMKYTQEAHPVKVRQLHVINCSSLLNKIMGLIKPLLRKEVAERIQFHEPNSETLYDYIPREILPKELGGTMGSLEEYCSRTMDYLHSYREYFMTEENWRLDT